MNLSLMNKKILKGFVFCFTVGILIYFGFFQAYYSSIKVFLTGFFNDLSDKQKMSAFIMINIVTAVLTGYLCHYLYKQHLYKEEAKQILVVFKQSLNEFQIERGFLRSDILRIEDQLPEKKRIYTGIREYFEYLSDRENTLFHENNDHCLNVLLYGSIVGFAFYLPRAIRNLVCENKEHPNQKLRIMGTDENINQEDRYWFPIFLATSVIKELCCSNCNFSNVIQEKEKNMKSKLVIVIMSHLWRQ